MITKEQFKDFLESGYDKRFVKDWVDLAKSDSLSVTENVLKASPAEKEVKKLNAFYIAFSYLATVYVFYIDKKDSELSLKEKIAIFIEDLFTNPFSLFHNYNPLSDNNIDKLLLRLDGRQQCESITDLFVNISLIHKEIFQPLGSSCIKIELVAECNSVFDEFFNCFQRQSNLKLIEVK